MISLGFISKFPHILFLRKKKISTKENLFGYFFEGLVESFHIQLVDYMYEFMYNTFWAKNCIFLGFEAILEMCYKLWSKTKLEAAPSIFKLEFWINVLLIELAKIYPLNFKSESYLENWGIQV